MAYPAKTKQAARRKFLAGEIPEHIARDLGVKRPDSVWDWARKRGWIEERAKLEAEEIRRTREKSGEDVGEVNARHVAAYRAMQRRALIRLLPFVGQDGQTVEPQFETVAAAAQALDLAVRGERRILGMAEGRMEHTGPGGGPLEHDVFFRRYTNEELNGLIAAADEFFAVRGVGPDGEPARGLPPGSGGEVPA
jgi:hypothetical protein